MTTITLSGGAAMTDTQKTALRVEIGATSAADVSGAIAAHVAAADPHPQYLTQTEGDARYAPAGISGATNLTTTVSPAGVTINSDTGTDAAIPLADGANAGVMAPAQVTKLAGLTQVSVINDLTTGGTSAALSAEQGKTLKTQVDGKATTAQGAKADSALQPGAQLTQAAVTSATAAGVAVLGAADAAAQRTALGLGTAATTAATAYATAAQGIKADAAMPNTAGALATTLEGAAATAPADLARIQASVSGGFTPVFVTGRTGRAYGASILASKTIPGNIIKAGARIKFRGNLVKYAPNNGGLTLYIKAKQGTNSVTLAQSFPGATLQQIPFEHYLCLSPDRKWAWTDFINVNLGATASLVAGSYNPFTVVASSSVASTSPRAKGNIAFSTYSAAPTVETVLIDWSQDVTITFELTATATDSYELLFFGVDQEYPTDASGLSPKLTLCGFDSLSEGTGSTAGNDWISVFAKTRSGSPVINEGLGGQTISQIQPRLLAYPAYFLKATRLVSWAGINDAQADQAAWWATVSNYYDAVIAARGGASGLIINNYHLSSAWGASIIAACQYVNAQLLAKYGAAVCDIYSVLSPGGAQNATYFSDAIHCNDAGYAAVAAAVNTKATALGWA